MNVRVTPKTYSIGDRLKKMKANQINVFVGFDACIDNIVRIVKDKTDNSNIGFYSDSRQFGEYLIRHENKSCGIELRTRQSKIGGNMVITANALGHLGMKVECAGTFGLPVILPIFRAMSSNCTLHTIGDTITTTAIEFNDAKVMMFDPGPYDLLDWNGIKKRLGLQVIKQLIANKQLVSFFNWSEIENSSQIWQGILTEILPSLATEEHPLFFTDFSDCSRRSKSEIRDAIALLGQFRKYFKIVISLNQNEAEIIADALDLTENNTDENFVKMLFYATEADELVIHRRTDALAYDGLNFEKCETFFCKEPVLLTGGGDNFNAGYCFARFCELDLHESLIVANAVSGYYVSYGSSPDVDSLAEFIAGSNSPEEPVVE